MATLRSTTRRWLLSTGSSIFWFPLLLAMAWAALAAMWLSCDGLTLYCDTIKAAPKLWAEQNLAIMIMILLNR
jgi:hypothetical protein